MNWIVGSLIAGSVAWGAHRLKSLTMDGAVAAFLIGGVIFALGQVPFSIPILIFFISSSILSKIGKARKSEITADNPENSQRNARQVLANGLVPAMLLLVWTATADPKWALLFLISVAAATADTWATEIGVLSKTVPRSILNFRKIAPGTSGGVSILGTLAAAAGALTISLTGLLVFSRHAAIDFSSRHILPMTAVALAAQFLDSLLGASVQVRYRCPRCSQTTENTQHCSGTETAKIRGLPWLDNDVVNFVSVSGGVLLGWLGLTVLA